MDNKLIKAYQSLVPRDKLIIDSMIISLVKKDKEIHELCEEIKKLMEKNNE